MQPQPHDLAIKTTTLVFFLMMLTGFVAYRSGAVSRFYNKSNPNVELALIEHADSPENVTLMNSSSAVGGAEAHQPFRQIALILHELTMLNPTQRRRNN